MLSPFAVLAALVALGCVAVSVERLRRVLSVAHYQLGARDAARFVELQAPPGSAEAEAREALEESRAGGLDRGRCLDAAAFEIDHRLASLGRAPRVAASIASSSAFLLAAASLRRALLDDAGLSEGASPLLWSAMQVVALGLAGSTACLALGREADRQRRREAATLEAWLDALASEDRHAS